MARRAGMRIQELRAMYQRLTRPLTDAERALIERWLAERGAGLGRPLLWGLVWFVASLAAWHLAPDWIGEAPSQLLSTALVALALVHLTVGFARWSRHREFRGDFFPRCREALADGGAEVERVEAGAAIAVADSGEGPATYFFDVGDGRVLYFGDPDLGPVDPQAPWPNSAFEIVRTARHGLWLGIHASGRRLVPLRRMAPASIDWDHLPEQDLFDARLDTLEDDMRRITEQRRGGDAETAARPQDHSPAGRG